MNEFLTALQAHARRRVNYGPVLPALLLRPLLVL